MNDAYETGLGPLFTPCFMFQTRCTGDLLSAVETVPLFTFGDAGLSLAFASHALKSGEKHCGHVFHKKRGYFSNDILLN